MRTAMHEPKYAFVEPGRDRRKRKEQHKALLKAAHGEERLEAMARLAFDFHENRELNMAMDTARQVLAESPDGVAFIVGAYVSAERADLEIEQIAMLADLARWLGDEKLCALVAPMAYDRALSWCGPCDGRERERRIDTLRRRFDDALADRVDLALL